MHIQPGPNWEIDPETAEPPPAWRGELANRIEAYRVRRRRVSPDAAQSRLPFTEPIAPPSMRITRGTRHPAAVAVAEPPLTSQATQCEPAEEDFLFTIAIGRIAAERRPTDGRMTIDVSLPVEPEEASADRHVQTPERRSSHGLYPVASMWDRRLAGFIDAIFLLFACGGFLALFGSLGGHFTLSKLTGAVCFAALAVVYLQYFALFTVFGGTTPGMMCRGLQVVSFSGDEPTPRQLVLRSIGYLLSAGTCFLGFFWALWDEDALTWHDRFSHTYLSSAQTYAEIESHTAAHPHN